LKFGEVGGRSRRINNTFTDKKLEDISTARHINTPPDLRDAAVNGIEEQTAKLD
jgi:hypothetical protein